MESIPAMRLTGKVESVLLTLHHDRGLKTDEARRLQFFIGEGVWGDKHYGPSRKVGDREVDLRAFGIAYGTKLANYRHWSAISPEEMAVVAERIGVPEIPPGFLGENLIISGIPELTHLPPNTKLFFVSRDGTKRAAVLQVTGENKPCIHPGHVLQERYPCVQDLAQKFADQAKGLRGVLGTVCCAGYVEAGDTVVVLVPKQRPYVPQVPRV